MSDVLINAEVGDIIKIFVKRKDRQYKRVYFDIWYGVVMKKFGVYNSNRPNETDAVIIRQLSNGSICKYWPKEQNTQNIYENICHLDDYIPIGL